MATGPEIGADESADGGQSIDEAIANYCLQLAICRRCEQQAGLWWSEEW